MGTTFQVQHTTLKYSKGQEANKQLSVTPALFVFTKGKSRATKKRRHCFPSSNYKDFLN